VSDILFAPFTGMSYPLSALRFA